jgi:hypothetical protein
MGLDSAEMLYIPDRKMLHINEPKLSLIPLKIPENSQNFD